MDAPMPHVYNVWAMPAAEGEATTLYLTLHNPTETPLDLVGGRTPFAESVTLRVGLQGETLERLTLDPDQPLDLSEVGLALVLEGLSTDLASGDAIPVTLIFASAEMGATLETEVLSAALVAEEAPTLPEDLVIYDFWTRPVIGGEGAIGAAYMRIANQGETVLSLVGGATEAAAVVEIHEMAMGEGDVMMMRPMPALELPAGETVVLEPGGLHVMLIGVSEDLAVGQAIPLTLVLEDGTEVTLAVPVRDLLMEGMSGHSGMDMGPEASAEDCETEAEALEACVIDLGMAEDEMEATAEPGN
ncbi:MAG: copper chaperone PCu(A)C [Anaerolineae bacterium]|nr:copper chaperone PCu(A)C [Anaerolineae bacterium]